MKKTAIASMVFLAITLAAIGAHAAWFSGRVAWYYTGSGGPLYASGTAQTTFNGSQFTLYLSECSYKFWKIQQNGGWTKYTFVETSPLTTCPTEVVTGTAIVYSNSNVEVAVIFNEGPHYTAPGYFIFSG